MKNIFLIIIFFSFSFLYPQTMYKVKSGDTLYNIAKEYNISIKKIIELNPKLIKNSLKLGDNILLFNYKSNTYEVKSKETIYSISKNFKIPQKLLLYFNPNIKNILKTGTILQIPLLNNKKYFFPKLVNKKLQFVNILKKESNSLSKIEDNKTLEKDLNLIKDKLNNTENKISSNKNINIIILLPLFKNFLKNNCEISKNAVNFYLGAKYAINLLSSKESIHVKFFDTENNKNKIKNFLNTYDFSKVHAVIGPFFRSNVEQVAKILQKKKIPVISPLISSKILDNYSNIIQSEIRDEFLSDPIIEEIKKNPSQPKTIYLLSDPQEKIVTSYLRYKLLKWKSNLKILSIKNFLNISKKNSPFVVILISNKPKIGNIFIKGISTFRPKEIFPLGIGYNPVYYNNLKWLKNYEIVFTIKYHVNDNIKTKKIIKFLFNEEKNYDKYKLLGFDIVYDILERLIKNKKLLYSIDNKPNFLVANKFQYEKTNSGSYINKGAWIVRFKSF